MKMKLMQETILNFFENEDANPNDYKEITKYFESQKIRNKNKLRSILNLVSKISKNHQRSDDLIKKTEFIINIFKKVIKKNFQNLEIFHIFRTNKRILLFLFESKILVADQSLFLVITSSRYKNKNYSEFFFPEFQSFYDKEKAEIIKTQYIENDMNLFKRKRRIGENDNYICQLIQNDSIDEFVVYVSKKCLNLNLKVNPSIFETNAFLIKNKPTLIEYAAFFGSVKIFKFLFLNNAGFRPFLWLYVIHGNNPELVHLLEDNNLQPQGNSFLECYIESVKCHHIDIMNYIRNNYFPNKGKRKHLLYSASLRYYNFSDFCSNLYWLYFKQIKLMFSDFCKFDYAFAVSFILKHLSFDINSKIGRILLCFL